MLPPTPPAPEVVYFAEAPFRVTSTALQIGPHAVPLQRLRAALLARKPPPRLRRLGEALIMLGAVSGLLSLGWNFLTPTPTLLSQFGVVAGLLGLGVGGLCTLGAQLFIKPTYQLVLETDLGTDGAFTFWQVEKGLAVVTAINLAITQQPPEAARPPTPPQETPEQVLQRAHTAYDQGRSAAAIADYTRLLLLKPGQARLLHLRGLAYEQMQAYRLALADYAQANARRPRFADPYINRGAVYGKLNNLPEAIRYATLGLRLDPSNTTGYFNRGAAHFRLGQFAAAVADFSHLLALAPQDAEAYYWRGLAQAQAGQPAAALADYRKVLLLTQNAQLRALAQQKVADLPPLA